MKALITGSNGFVGGYLASALLEKKWSVVGLAEKHTKATNHKVIRCNILDKVSLSSTLSKTRPDVVFHLAAQSSVPKAVKNPTATFRVNIDGTINLYDAILDTFRKQNRPRIIYISSGDAYGFVQPRENPINELQPFRPQNPYALSKAIADTFSQLYAKSKSLDVVVLRPFNHIGSGQSPQFVTPAFAKQIAEIEGEKQPAIIKVGDLNVTRDFLDVRDVVRAYILAVEKCKAGDVYNIASGKGIKIKDILTKLLSLTDVKIKVKVDKGILRRGETSIRIGNSGKFRRLTSWRPEITINKSLQDILEYWRRGV